MELKVKTIGEIGCHIFHLEIFTVLQLTMNTLEDELTQKGGDLKNLPIIHQVIQQINEYSEPHLTLSEEKIFQ